LDVARIRRDSNSAMQRGNDREFLPCSRQQGMTSGVDGISEQVPLRQLVRPDRGSGLMFGKSRQDHGYKSVVPEHELDGEALKRTVDKKQNSGTAVATGLLDPLHDRGRQYAAAHFKRKAFSLAQIGSPNRVVQTTNRGFDGTPTTRNRG